MGVASLNLSPISIAVSINSFSSVETRNNVTSISGREYKGRESRRICIMKKDIIIKIEAFEGEWEGMEGSGWDWRGVA